MLYLGALDTIMSFNVTNPQKCFIKASALICGNYDVLQCDI